MARPNRCGDDLTGARVRRPGIDRRAGGGDLGPAEFERIRDLLLRTCGINLQHGKEQLVKARLWRRISQLGLSSFEEYVALIETPVHGERELVRMVEALTTNKTSFFREKEHFDFLRGELNRPFLGDGLRIWSAGCSTGEEPYSIAITVCEALPGPARRNTRVLATDLNAQVLEKGRAGVYDASAAADLPPALRSRYFTPQRESNREERIRVVEPVRDMVRFARLNLMADWPMRGPFDFVFCRNVMIYFDPPTQESLVRRFIEILRPGGCLLVGMSESLTGKADGLTYVMPAVYRR